MEKMKLYAYSGNCLLAECGIPVSFKDWNGADLHTGDIVLLWYRSPLNDPDAAWETCEGLTAIVEDKYTTYSDGSIKISDQGNPFVMGIRTVDMAETKEWAVQLVKKYYDVVNGEHWSRYGFKYSASPVVIQEAA